MFSSHPSTSSASGNRFKRPIIVALVAFCIQFGSSELLYQISVRTAKPGLAEGLTTASNLIAWPADLIYTEMEKNLYVDSLEDLVSMKGSQEAIPEEQLQKAKSLLQTYEESGDTEQFVLDCSTWLNEMGIDAYLPTSQEYAIYIGTCLAWAIFIGSLVYIISEPQNASRTRDFRNLT